MVLDGSEERLGVEAGHHDERRTLGECAQRDDRETEDVEHR